MLFANGDETPAEEARSGELVVIDDAGFRSKLGATAETSTFKIDAAKAIRKQLISPTRAGS